LRIDRSLRGALVTAQGLLEEDKKSSKDELDKELDILRKSRTLKCNPSSPQ